MSATNRRNDRRDEVLFAFHEAYKHPTDAETDAWADRYPEFAEDIRAHAVIANEIDLDNLIDDTPTESELAKAHSRALGIIYDADRERELAAAATLEITFHELAERCGKDIRRIAKDMSAPVELPRSVVADLFNGHMCGPFVPHFECGIQSSLGVGPAQFHVSLVRTIERPQLEHANASAPPVINVRTYEEIIRATDMDDNQRRYWLDGS